MVARGSLRAPDASASLAAGRGSRPRFGASLPPDRRSRSRPSAGTAFSSTSDSRWIPMGTIALTAERPSARHRAGASLVAIGPARPATTGRPDSWQRHSEAGAAVESRSEIVRAQAPHALDVADCDSAPSWLGGRLRASTITSCVGMDRIEGGSDFDHRAVAWACLAVISSLPARSLLPIVRCTSADLGRPGLRNPPAKRQSRRGLLRHAKGLARCWPRRRRPMWRSDPASDRKHRAIALRCDGPCLRLHAPERDRRCDAAARTQPRSLLHGASDQAATAMLMLEGTG